MSARPFAAWPGREIMLDAARLTAGVGALFGVVYGGADFITAHRERLHLFLPVELGIPLWPWTVLVYDSIYVPFLLAPFVVRDRARLKALAAALCSSILFAGAGFLLLPAELGYPAPVVTGPLHGIFHLSYAIALTYNLVPSLHVCLSFVCLQTFAREAPGARIALLCWAVAIALSTLLTHQHHLLDVAAGIALSRWIYLRVYLKGEEECSSSRSLALTANPG